MTPPASMRPRSGNPLGAAMTPMIDVVFLLLVFFLCTSTFEAPEEDLAASLLVESSGSIANETTPPEQQLEEISLAGSRTEDGTVWTVNEGVAATAGDRLTELLARLAAIDPSLPVTIESESVVPLGDVVAAYDSAREAGFRRVQLVASAPDAHSAGAQH